MGAEIGGHVRLTAGQHGSEIEVHEVRVSVVLDVQAEFVRHRAVDQLVRVHNTVPHDVREGASGEGDECVREGAVRALAAADEFVVVDVDAFGVRVVAGVVVGAPGGEVRDHRQVRVLVVVDPVSEQFDIVAGHDDDTRAGRNRGDDRSLLAEVGQVVVGDLVVVDARVAAVLDRKLGQGEDEQAAGVAVGPVFVDVGAGGVLDLDAGHVLPDLVAPDHDVGGLADVDAGVRGAAYTAVLDQDVRHLNGVETVGAVVRVRSVRPLDPHAAEGGAGGALDLDAVAEGVLDREALNREVVGRHQHPLAAGARRLAGEVEDGLVHALAAQRHALDVEGQGGVEHETAGAELDDRTWLRDEQRLLQRLVVVGARAERSVLFGAGDQSERGGGHAEILFLHGLGGSPVGRWRSSNRSKQPRQSGAGAGCPALRAGSIMPS